MADPIILVVDDSVSDVHLLRRALDTEQENYELVVLTDGEAALMFVNEHRQGRRELVPCVIVLDAHLPRHNGLEVLRAIRTAPALDHINVVMLSGVITPKLAGEARKEGALCREKPLDLDSYMALGAEIFALCRSRKKPVLKAVV